MNKHFLLTVKHIATIAAIWTLGVLPFSACVKDVESCTNGNEPKPVEVNVKAATVQGKVLDVDGFPLSGVTVSTGTQSVTTAEDGTYSFMTVGTVDGRFIIHFSKSNYFPVIRSGEYKEEITIDAVLPKQGKTNMSINETFSATADATLQVEGGMTVKIPASSLVSADGKPYTGTVTAQMLYLDPAHEYFSDLMPGGDLVGIRADNSKVRLISYGMTDVRLTGGDGKPLQLAEGEDADISFPIPEGINATQPTVPLWYFDEEHAVWVEEGVLTQSGQAYQGKVKHFSYYNCDWYDGIITLNGKVTDEAGTPLRNLKVSVEITSGLPDTDGYTNSEGEYSIIVPANQEFRALIKSREYYYYTPELSYTIPAKSVGSTVTQNFTLPNVVLVPIVGRLINTCDTIVAATVWLEVGSTVLNKMGVTSSEPFVYNVPTMYTGQATFYAESMTGEKVSQTITLDGKQKNITLQLCMTLQGILITSTESGKEFKVIIPDENGEMTVYPYPNSIDPQIVDHLASVVTSSSVYSVYSEEYAYLSLDWMSYPAATNHATGYLSGSNTNNYDSYLVSLNSIIINPLNHVGDAWKLYITSDGVCRCYDLTTGAFKAEFPVYVRGIITAKIKIYNYFRGDIKTWTDFKAFVESDITNYWSRFDANHILQPSAFNFAAIPELPTPIDGMLISSHSPVQGDHIALGYANGNQAMFDDIVQRFKNAGYTVNVGLVSNDRYPDDYYLGATAEKDHAAFTMYFDSVNFEDFSLTIGRYEYIPGAYPLLVVLSEKLEKWNNYNFY